MFEELIRGWSYGAIVLGTFIEGEVVLIAAGTLCQQGVLSFPLVLLAGCAGSLAWSQCWFRLGRRLGLRSVERRVAWRARAEKICRWLGRHATVFVLGFRFIAGMGTVAPLFLGASGYPMKRFIGLDVMGAAAWTIVFSGAGCGLSAALGRLLGRPLGLPELLATVAFFVILLWGVTQLTRRLLARHASATQVQTAPRTTKGWQ